MPTNYGPIPQIPLSKSMPTLTRKLYTVIVQNNPNKKRYLDSILSPVEEATEADSLAGNKVKLIVPAILKALNPRKFRTD